MYGWRQRRASPPGVEGTGTPTLTPADRFIARWSDSERAERTNAPPFLIELCALLGVPAPDPARGGDGPYRFERSVTHYDPEDRATTRRIDLYKRDCFILEAKQGANSRPQAELFALSSEATRRQVVRNSPGWAQHMLQAKGQAEGYVRNLPAKEAAPPFLIVCDVGFCFDLYADFSGTGRHYAQFPDGQSFRVYVTELTDPAKRQLLADVWTDPASLDPSRRRTEVTRDIAALLARLAVTMEARHPPDAVAFFLIRCIFCMFAQSVGLLPEASFTALLHRCEAQPDQLFVPMIGDLWRTMNAGGFSAAITAMVRRFNGGLFAPARHGGEPLGVTLDELRLLVAASTKNWANVEPAIFGTLLESALSTRERGQLGAHFTPRAFVERLVLPTIMEPLRWEWDATKAASGKKIDAGDRAGAAAELRAFHHRLCTVRVLDPACGTGNFLYVTLELMKRLEGEVLDALANLQAGEGGRLELPGETVDPHQFLGLEKNPRAVPVAELVLWIGHLQWHFRTRGAAPPAEPILRDFHNIVQSDSLLSYQKEDLLRDDKGVPITRWDGHTMKLHPITGEKVPDERARIEVTRPVGARMTQWPDADFIVGNPPFIAGKDMRAELGEGYVEALWQVYQRVPESADIALFFWWRAAQLLIANKSALRRFGFITSNSIRQIFCRRVVAEAMTGKRRLRLVFAIPDHPWSDGKGAAAVRIAMTVAERASRESGTPPRLERVTRERTTDQDAPEVEFAVTVGDINADLSIGANPDDAHPLQANEGISSPGVKLHGAGFIVTAHQAAGLGLGKVPGLERHIRPYLNGRDLTQRSRNAMVIDLFGLTEDEVRRRYPSVYQYVEPRIKPERDQNSRATYRLNWWIFGEPRSELRAALDGLPRYIATVETAKHRVFCFLPASVLPDNKLINIATDDAFHLGVLSSRTHVQWALEVGARLEDRPVYVKSICFDPFPFPAASRPRRSEIASIAEELDGLRRTALETHPQLTMTGLYNVLDALRANRALTPAERDINEAGHVLILRHLHDRLDTAVADAYGWPVDLAPAEIVARVVALNIARRAEEQAGTVRWLRPGYQTGKTQRGAQSAIVLPEGQSANLPAWPTQDRERLLALRSSLAAAPGKPADIARRFAKATPARIQDMLETLVSYGQAHRDASGAYRL